MKKKNQVSGTREWATGNINIQTGCENNCLYCYARVIAMQFGRCTRESWQYPVINTNKVNRKYQRKQGCIMFPSTHDITQFNINECLTVLKRLLSVGNEVLVVSKPNSECVRKLCEELKEYQDQIVFRFTIGSADNKVLGFWEPNAPKFVERLRALEHAYKAGFKTSVLCEPVLDNDIDKVITSVSPYVTDSIWLSRVNNLRLIVSLNCPGDKKASDRADKLLDLQNDELYARHKNDPQIKWKDFTQKVVGLDRPKEASLDQ